MRITIVHPFTPQAAGVVEASVATYHSQPHVKAMAILSSKYGYDCSLQYFTPKWRKYSFKKEHLSWEFFPVDFKWNGDHKKWKKQVSKACLKDYETHTPEVTIINMSGHSSPFSNELAKVIRSKEKKYIAMLGGQHYTDVPWAREYYANAHHILVHTHLQKKAMGQMELFRGKDIRVFPLGVDCTVFKPQEKLESKNPVLLYVGRIVEWKRIHLAIQALNELVSNGFTNATLKIIGPISSNDYFKELQDLVLQLNLVNQVHFLGHKEHYELPGYFQEADLLVLPSNKETFGMVMIESMACGTPVAGMDCPGGPADVIENKVDGLLSTPETYAQDILEFFQSKPLVALLKTNARKKVEAKFSIEETFRVLEQSVQSAL